MLAGRWFGDAERGCGRALSRASGDALLRARPFLFRGPARTCEPAAGRTSARGRNDRPRSGRFARGPLPPPLSQVRSLVGERPNTNPFCLTFAGEGLLTLLRRRAANATGNITSSATGSSGAMGNNGTPYAAVLPYFFSLLQWDTSRFREMQQLICRRCMKQIRDLRVNHSPQVLEEIGELSVFLQPAGDLN